MVFRSRVISALCACVLTAAGCSSENLSTGYGRPDPDYSKNVYIWEDPAHNGCTVVSKKPFCKIGPFLLHTMATTEIYPDGASRGTIGVAIPLD